MSNHKARNVPVIATTAFSVVAAMVLVVAAPGAEASTSTNWRSYVEGPRSSDVRAVAANVLSGVVHNPRGLVTKGNQSVTLTVAAGGAPATVLLDYGKEVVGTPFVTVTSYTNTGTSPALVAAFSETRKHLNTPGSSTLASGAAAGATAITVATASTFAVGDTILVGSSSNRITAISGTTLTLAQGLASVVAAGTAVTSAPGQITGDSGGFGPNNRLQSIPITARSQLAGQFEGGFRFEAITLATPGTVVLKAAGVNFEAYRATASQYQGYFLSSSDQLNKMWYDGAYTVQTDMQPAGVQGATQPGVLDGAKRDRAIWSGDLAVEGPVILNSLGSNGSDYVKQSLLRLITSSTLGSGLNAQTLFGGTGPDGAAPWGNTYSSWTVDDAVDYFRSTADTAFATQILPYLEGQLSYDSTFTNADGLLSVAGGLGYDGAADWDPYDAAKSGVASEPNMLYFRILSDVAYLEGQLGDTDKATEYQATAAKVKAAINDDFYNPTTGAYDTSETVRGTIAQDANSLAVLFGIAPSDKIPGILTALKSLWGTHGSQAYSANANQSPLISPYITGFEVEALYKANDPVAAEKLLTLTWNQMTDPRNPAFTGTFWENFNPDGTIPSGSTSTAHGWSAGPTAALTNYVLGVQAADPGFKTFTVAPHFGTLSWAKGEVPTPHGQISVSWARHGNKYTLTVQAPPGTTASITIPGGPTVIIHGGDHGKAKTLTATA